MSENLRQPNCKRSTGANRLLVAVLGLQVLTLGGLWAGVPSSGVAHAAGIPDPGARQMQMIDELKQMNSKLDRLLSVLESGTLQVRVAEDDVEQSR